MVQPIRALACQPSGNVPGGFQNAAPRSDPVVYTSPSGRASRMRATKRPGSRSWRAVGSGNIQHVNGSSSNARASASASAVTSEGRAFRTGSLGAGSTVGDVTGPSPRVADERLPLARLSPESSVAMTHTTVTGARVAQCQGTT